MTFSDNFETSVKIILIIIWVFFIKPILQKGNSFPDSLYSIFCQSGSHVSWGGIASWSCNASCLMFQNPSGCQSTGGHWWR